MKLFQTEIHFLGHTIDKGKIVPIDRSFEFALEFPNVITHIKTVKRFVGGLNYVADYDNLVKGTAILYTRLKKNPSLWTNKHTVTIRKIKEHVKYFPYFI